MADDCLPQIHGVRMRLTDLDPDGVPSPGVGSVVVTSALTRVAVEPVYLDGNEITDRTAADEICLDYRGKDNFRRVNVTIELCTQDPAASSKLGGDILLPDDEDRSPGWQLPAIGALPTRAIGVEVWARRIKDGREDVDFPYGWHLLPFVTNLRPGNREFNATRQANVFTGQGYENVNWFDGPSNDWPGLTSDRAYQWMPAIAAELPAAACGLLDLVAS